MGRYQRFVMIASISAATVLIGVTPAGAAPSPPFEVSGDAVLCDTVGGKIQFPDGLTSGSAAMSVAVKVSGQAQGCSDLDNPSVLQFRGKFASAPGLVADNADCAAWFSGVSPVALELNGPGSDWVQTSWRPAAGQQFSSTATSVVSSSPMHLAYHGVDVTDLDGFYREGDLSGDASGAFAPSAAEWKLRHVVQQDIGVIFDKCSTPRGLRSLTIGLGQLSSGF